MFKIAAVVSLMLIGSTLWAAGLSCESCGRECASACGTRHFRACCFNYLRRKRTNLDVDFNKIWAKHADMKTPKDDHIKRIPILAIENIEPWMTNIVPNDIEAYQYEDTVLNRLPFE